MTQLPAPFDGIYFRRETWSQRLSRWRASQTTAFAGPNEASIVRRLDDDDTAARVVVNIRATALQQFLATGIYLNAYDIAVGGGPPPDDYRRAVDARVEIGDATYFAAVSIGGSGVRYFGEYCMVLRVDIVDDATRLLDRDSYDVLYSPLDQLSDDDVRTVLRGTWSEVKEMILMRVLPRITHDLQVVTSGTVIELALTDQEYIEVHLSETFTPGDVEQVLDSPESTATEARILERERKGLSNPMHELLWARRKADVAAELDRRKIPQRVVTQHGRGYQWR